MKTVNVRQLYGYLFQSFRIPSWLPLDATNFLAKSSQFFYNQIFQVLTHLLAKSPYNPQPELLPLHLSSGILISYSYTSPLSSRKFLFIKLYQSFKILRI